MQAQISKNLNFCRLQNAQPFSTKIHRLPVRPKNGEISRNFTPSQAYSIGNTVDMPALRMAHLQHLASKARIVSHNHRQPAAFLPRKPEKSVTSVTGWCWKSGDEDVLPVVVEVGEMAGGGGAAEVEIPVEVQEGAVLGVQGGGEDQGAGVRREAVVIPATRKNLSLLSPAGGGNQGMKTCSLW